MNWIKKHKRVIWVTFWGTTAAFGVFALVTGTTAGGVLVLCGAIVLIKEVIAK